MKPFWSLLPLLAFVAMAADDPQHHHHDALAFSVRSAVDGNWSDPATWEPARVPKRGDRVLVSRGTEVTYDVAGKDVLRLVQVAGTLRFARDRDTELNVGLLKVQDSEVCTESGFSCDFEQDRDEAPAAGLPALLVGTPDAPIPAGRTARIRLHHLEGMSKEDAPAVACCSARMELHGNPMARTWVKLAADAAPGARRITVAEPLDGWRVGDEVIVTASERQDEMGTFREGGRNHKEPRTEEARIASIDGTAVTLDRALEFAHAGAGEFRCEMANLSRNVIVESADPDGVRGHTVFHRFSRGGISYARFAHLGKEGVLGRYPIHYHLVGDTMRGSQVLGAAIVDSRNRWVTIHGTQFLVVRDCVGYRSVGHGYFLEDGTEVYNLLDRNLAVQAHRGERLPKQVLSFDPNDGAGYWWANGLNSFTRNVSVENDEYGYRYDMRASRTFDPNLPVLQPDGSERIVDVRTLPIWRFQDNEAHAEGFYGMVVAANGHHQPDSPIRDEKALERIKRIDWTGPDTRHPHRIGNLSIWGAHYAFRPQSPAMRVEGLRIHRAVYGVYRPAFEDHEYVDVHISQVAAEPFNRGMDDAAAQTGRISVDGLRFSTGYGNSSTPLVQISDVNIGGEAETHMRDVTVERPAKFRDRWPLFNRGVGTRVPPITEGVPIYVHDHFGPGRHAKVVSAAAKDLLADGDEYRREAGLTGDEARVAEVRDVEWPEILDPVDDVPPATVVTSVRRKGDRLVVAGTTHDNGGIVAVRVNGVDAASMLRCAGVLDWRVSIPVPADGEVVAAARDKAGNKERNPHRLTVAADADSEHSAVARANRKLVAGGKAKQRACPVTGRAPNPERRLEVDGIEVEFCCVSCRGRVARSAEDVRRHLVFGRTAFARGFSVLSAR